MWDLATIIAMNKKAHQDHLKKEGITEEEWQQRANEQARASRRCVQNVEEQRILVAPGT